MVAQTGARDEVVVAALLHDVVEDTPVTLADIKAAFGADVATLVEMVTDVSCLADGNGRRRKTMDQTIKLADLIDNTASITRHDPGFTRVYMHEKRELLDVLTRGDQELHQQAAALAAQYTRQE